MGEIEQNLKTLGVDLPEAAAPAANYIPYLVSGNMLYISGQITMGPNGIEHQARLGENYSIEQGQDAAKLCAINILAQAKAALGDIERIQRLVKITGFVNSTPDFGDQPAVINGASDFLVAALGERGRHTRSAVGVSNLPFGVATEVEAIIQIAD